ncbi:MAG: hypothetical protein OXC11_07460 [Rhodospirillales bacterium]|nr:hypothetical protein [Alphaproteobacteria bacterium]MCY4430215.1 hypothetical protein [Rhodospirillales bacterium]
MKAVRLSRSLIRADLVPSKSPPAAPTRHHGATPELFSASEKSERRFWEFFTAHIRNPNTRVAYLAAVRRFAEWCEGRGIMLDRVEPVPEETSLDEIERIHI